MMFFAYIAREICKKLKKEHITTLVVLLPFFLSKYFQQAIFQQVAVQQAAFPQRWSVQYIFVNPDKKEATREIIETITTVQAEKNSVDYLFFGLFSAYQKPATELLQAAQQGKAKIYIADVRLAQRNIDYPACWYTQLVYRVFLPKQAPHYSAFMQQGAIEGVVTAQGLFVAQRKDLAFGAFSLLYL